jgi:hypothetical protein
MLDSYKHGRGDHGLVTFFRTTPLRESVGSQSVHHPDSRNAVKYVGQ